MSSLTSEFKKSGLRISQERASRVRGAHNWTSGIEMHTEPQSWPLEYRKSVDVYVKFPDHLKDEAEIYKDKIPPILDKLGLVWEHPVERLFSIPLEKNPSKEDKLARELFRKGKLTEKEANEILQG